jgi:hypothetical protein
MLVGYFAQYKCDHCPPERPKFVWQPEVQGMPMHWSARTNSNGDEEHTGNDRKSLRRSASTCSEAGKEIDGR